MDTVQDMERNNAAMVRRAPPILTYAAALGSVVLVTVVSRLLQPDLGGVYLLYTSAVMFAAWFGGRGPGLVATVTATMVGNYWVIGGGQWNLSAGALVTAGFFVGVSAVIISLSENLLRTLGKLTALQHVTESDLAHFELDRLLAELLNRATDLLNGDVAAVLFREDDTLVEVASKGLAAERPAASIPIGTGFDGRVAKEKRVVIVNTISADLPLPPPLRNSGVCALVGAPLIVGGDVRGVIHVGATKPRTFAPEEGELLQVVADRVALAIEHARVFEQERGARRHAEAASEAKDRLLAIVSHELRTPLTVLTGWLWTLRKDEPGQRARAIDEIERNAQTLARLIDDLLDVARAMTGKLQLTVAPVTLPEVLSKASEVMLPAMSAKNIEFNVTADADLPPIVGDADRLQQVFWNLLSNSVKFTPAGGRIDARVSRSGVNVVVSIADSGIGIPGGLLPHVFERFRQQDDSSTRQHGGLGLGLSIVRNIVELHGGTVEAASDGEGRGSMFTVALPVPAIAAASAAPQETVTKLLNGVRILFVDDQADARDTVRAVLEQFGATVMTAASVADALVVLSAFKPDALLADIAMPGEDGLSLIGRLRSEGGNRAIPAAALTAYGKEHRDKILQAGYQMYISKPVAPPELAGLVQQLAARSRMH